MKNKKNSIEDFIYNKDNNPLVSFWDWCVDVGRKERLKEVSVKEANEQIARLLNGEPELNVVSLPNNTSEDVDNLEHIEDIAVASALCISDDISSLNLDIDINDKAWRTRLIRVLHARDDLEGVAVLLRRASCSERIDSAIIVLDRVGRQFIRSIPKIFVLDDERLQLAVAVNPEGWWTQLC
jgi:hypothetical protein